MNSTIVPLLTARHNPFSGNPECRNSSSGIIVLTERNIFRMQVLLECCYTQMESSQWEQLQSSNYQKGCTRFTATSDKVYQLLAHGRWFSPGTPASSTNKTGRHDLPHSR